MRADQPAYNQDSRDGGSGPGSSKTGSYSKQLVQRWVCEINFSFIKTLVPYSRSCIRCDASSNVALWVESDEWRRRQPLKQQKHSLRVRFRLHLITKKTGSYKRACWESAQRVSSLPQGWENRQTDSGAVSFLIDLTGFFKVSRRAETLHPWPEFDLVVIKEHDEKSVSRRPARQPPWSGGRQKNSLSKSLTKITTWTIKQLTELNGWEGGPDCPCSGVD